MRSLIFTGVLLAVILSACGPSSSNAGRTPSGNATVAVIRESPSTNTPAVAVTIRSNGNVVWHVAPSRTDTSGHLSRALHSRIALSFLQDLRRLGSVHAIKGAAGQCVKSASFGTTITVTYRGETSTDLTCLSSNSSPAAAKVANEARNLTSRGIQSSQHA